MLTAEYLDGLTDDILQLYAGLNETIARDIARRIVKTGTLTQTASWQAARLQENGLLFEEVIAEVAKYSGRIEQQVRDLFAQAGAEAVEQDARIYRAAGLFPKPLLLSPSAMQILLAGAQKTSKQLVNLTKTTALEAQQAYIRACTLAEMQVESGAFDAVTAWRNAVRSIADEGAFVQYPSGHRDRVDVAVRRAVLTGVNQTCGEISLHNMDTMGCDLVEVTAHPGARPEHAAWQGRIFSRSGKHPKYPHFETVTGYGTGAGLCGWNCRHSFHPFFEGLSESAYPRETLAEYETRTVDFNGKQVPYYEATQMQRSYERQIRKTRRELAAYDTAVKEGGAELKQAMQADFTSASVKLKQQEAKLKDFLRQTGLRKDAARVQVDRFGRSVSQRAVWANRRKVSFADNTISPFDNQIKHLAHEEAIVYDVNGKFIMKRVGTKDKVHFTAAEFKLLNGCVLTHNHPSNGPLSIQDIFNLWKGNLAEVRAATSHGVFSAKQPTTWKKTPQLSEMEREMFTYAAKYRNQILRRVSSGSMNNDEAEYLLQRIVMRRITRDYGVGMELIAWKK